MKYEIGERCSVRLGIFSGNMIITCYIRKKFLWYYLVEWGVSESWDGTPPFTEYRVAKWKSGRRLMKGAK